MLFAGLGSVRMVKNCDLGRENAAHFQALGHSFSSHGPPSRQITYIYLPREDKVVAVTLFLDQSRL